jgi:hypothetical protein
MSKYAGEKYRIIPLALNTSTTTEVRSQAVSLRGVERVTVVCGWNMDLNVLDSAAHAESSLANSATFAVYVGDATQNPASFAALTSATCVLGYATVGQANNCESVQIQVVGSWATGRELTIGYGNTTKTFTMQTNATIADQQLSASDATAFANALGSALKTWFPNLEVVAGTTVGSGDTKAWSGIIKEKVQGVGLINVAASIQDVSTAAVGCVFPNRQIGLIEFTPAKVTATNASYSQFAVGIDSSATAADMTAFAILETNYQSPAGVRITPAG